MSTTIDSLDIQIKTSADQANSSLDRLANTIDRITTSFGRASQPTSGGFSAQVKGIVNGLKGYNSTARVTKKTTLSLAATFGRFYANCWLLVRGLKALWRSIEGTTDYIEAYNYFDVSFGKIASEWQNEYGKFGYDNAEAYAKSFTTRMNSILGKMSGVSLQIGEDGNALLTETGLANLGMNIREMTQAASNIASITNSVGQTGEVSLAAAQSLTALAGDIASLFNIDYSSAMTNLKSGLIGQSRALYKYGIDITNATLQTYAYEHGITKAVSEMSQAEKMQLRLLAILDQSKVAWGDLANTINSPSNMIRQFKNNIAELGTVIGQLFIPVLSKVMPFINGVTIALKRLMTTIAGFFGIKINLKDYGPGYNDDTIDGLEDVAAGYDGATAAAKKYQKTILGFDQLNKLNDNESSSGGGFSGGGGGFDLTGDILDATSGYLDIWNAAYEQMENKALEFADKITSALFPVRMFLADIAHGNWELAGQSLSLMLTSVIDFFSNVMSGIDWYQMGYNLGLFLSGIDWFSIMQSVGTAIWEAIKAALELLFGSYDAAPLEMGIVTAIAALKWTGLGKTLLKVLGNLGSLFWAWFSKDLFPVVGVAISKIASFLAGPGGLLVIGAVAGIIAIIANWDEIVVGAKKAWESVKSVTTMLLDGLKRVMQNWWAERLAVLSGISSWFSNNVISPTSKAWSNFCDGLGRTVENTWQWILNLFAKGGQIFNGVADGVSSVFKNIVNTLIRGVNNVIAIPFNKVNSLLNKIRTTTVLGFQPFKNLWGYSPLPVPRIPTFATGGFPEDGLFMANHGELVGQFSNGKTAVANNEQITQGIAQAVFPAVYNAVRSAMSESNNGGNQMIDNRIYIGEEEVARAVTRGQQKLNRRYQLSTT